MRTLGRSPLCGVVSVALLIVVRSTQAASCCPGDINGDHVVTVDEILRTVNAALNGCAAVPVPCQGGGLLTTGQTQCDQGSGTLGACPGSPPGQDAAVGAGAPLSYTDNGDGTITDNVTGLMWEKLSQGNGGIHDVNNTYTWDDALNVKITALNAAPCFAGHCDWRLPNRRELESLVDAGRVAPAIDPAFNTQCVIPGPSCTVTTCSCTQLNFYWSSTTYEDIPTNAWAVDGNTGRVTAYQKYNPPIPLYVRALRGGL
jgi:hypothetical protein